MLALTRSQRIAQRNAKNRGCGRSQRRGKKRESAGGGKDRRKVEQAKQARLDRQ